MRAAPLPCCRGFNPPAVGWVRRLPPISSEEPGTLSPDLRSVAPEQPPRDACGVFGVWAPGEDVPKLTYFGLYALQHRGQEAAGMAVSDGTTVLVYKDLGLVAQVFDEATLDSLSGHIAIGHARYSTTGSCTWENAQPSFRSIGRAGKPGGSVALGHNGNLINTEEIARRVAERAPEQPD